MRKTIYLAALILIGYFSLNGQTVKKSHVTNQPEKLINLLDGWKFKTGDNSDWAKIKIDDSQWSNIDITNPWEKQGFKGYDGYAWYRIKIVIPSSLSKVSFLKDSIQFILGKIDDCDQFYLNGIFIGENNKITTKPSFDETFEKEGFYGEERRYVLSVKNPNIHWNKENIIAVRVFDHGSNGGFYNSQPCIRMLDIRDKKIVDNTSRAFTFTGNKVQKRYIIKNSTDIQLKGTYSISAYINESRESILNQQNEINLKPGESKEFAVSFG